MNKFEYKNLTPFKWFVIENFPFIEADFDALTDWQIFCKLGKEINKIINSTNTLGIQVESLTDYVKNYFDNLDVKEEINNKLNEMAEDGTLQEIITQYLQINGVLSFDTINNLKNATNLINGSVAYTLGVSNYNDGKGAFYRIRNILNTDVVDNYNIVPLTNFPNLVGERIISEETTLLNNLIEKNKQIYSLKNRRIICIGDSYLTGSTAGQQYATDGWATRLINLCGLQNSYAFGDGGSGFTVTGHQGKNFETLITSNLENITNKDTITDIIVCGGYNDKNSSPETIKEAMLSFMNVCKTNFPNAKVYFGCIAGNSEMSATGRDIRSLILNRSLFSYKTCNEFGGIYLDNVELILKNYSLISSDNFHPTPAGYETIASSIFQAWIGGSFSKQSVSANNILENEDFSGTQLVCFTQINNNTVIFAIDGLFSFKDEVQLQLNTPIKLGHLNTPHIRKSSGYALNFQCDMKLGSSFLPTQSVIYIDENNDLYVVFYSLPAGITQAKFFRFTKFTAYIPAIYC